MKKRSILIALILAVTLTVAVTFPASADDDYPPDKEGIFVAISGYGTGYKLACPGLHNQGDVFPIKVQKITGGKVYQSFCAYDGANFFAGAHPNFHCEGYVVVAPGLLPSEENDFLTIDRVIKAYNCIMDNEELNKLIDDFDDLDDCRSITQIMTWWLLGDLIIPSADFDMISWDNVEKGSAAVAGIPGAKAIILDIIDKVESSDEYSGAGKVSDVWYMICEVIANPDHPSSWEKHSHRTCQPQFVPHYRPKEPGKGRITINKEWFVDSTRLSDAAADAYTATFSVYAGDYDETKTPVDTLTIQGNGSATSKELDPGDYTVREDSRTYGGYVWGFSIDNGGKVEVEENKTKNVDAANSREIPKPGRITVNKTWVVNGLQMDDEDAEAFEARFLIYKAGYDEDDEPVDVLTVKGNGSATSKDLDAGGYVIVEETNSIGGYNWVMTIDGDGKVTVREGGAAEVDVVNSRLRLGLFKRFQWSGVTRLPSGVRFVFELYVVGGELDGRVVATGSYTTTGNEIQGENIFLPLAIEDDFDFDPELDYRLRERGPAPTNWTFLSGEYLVGYQESTSEGGETYRELFYQQREGDEFIQGEGYRYGPVFVNRYTWTPPPGPEYGRLVINKAFNINAIPASWSATITVTGPNGFNVTRTITGASRTITLDNLDPGVYTITEANPAGIPGYVYVGVTGEGNYTVRLGNTTTATITNRYNEEEDGTTEIEPPEPPLTEMPPEEDIEDTPPPKTELPKTGIESGLPWMMWCLSISLLAFGATLSLIVRGKRRRHTR